MNEIFRKRRSIRAYLDKEIEKEKIESIKEAITSAPSAGNLQAYEACYTTEKGKIKEIAEACMQEFIAQAGAVFVFFADPGRSKRKYGERGELYSLQDASIACAYAHLEASSLGLGSCWVGYFKDEELRKICRAGSNLVPVAVLPVGYPAENPKGREKEMRLKRI
ncbi:MAG: nitroreductase family protein [Candidatus Anstonellales archaeon]